MLDTKLNGKTKGIGMRKSNDAKQFKFTIPYTKMY